MSQAFITNPSSNTKIVTDVSSNNLSNYPQMIVLNGLCTISSISSFKVILHY